MKFALILIILFTQQAMALSIVCESQEKTNGQSSLRLKINPKKAIRQGKNTWYLYTLGVTTGKSIFNRQILYASGSVGESSISLTIVKDDFVYGYIAALPTHTNGIYTGTIRISGVMKNRDVPVTCNDEELNGRMNL